jgi:hypothetical protein
LTIVLTKLAPESGPASGGDFVRIAGVDIPEGAAVRFGEALAEPLRRLPFPGGVYLDVRTPPHAPGTVDVEVVVGGERRLLQGAYRYARAPLLAESDATRVVRKLLRLFKANVLENTSIATSIDFSDGSEAVAVATLPALVLTGPRVAQNRFYATNESEEEPWQGHLRRRRPPFTVDFEFGITVASSRTTELLNLVAATSRFLYRHPWLSLPRDPADPLSPLVRWEMAPTGDLRTNLEGPADVRSFTWGLVVRGVDIDEGLPLDLAALVQGEAHLTFGDLE